MEGRRGHASELTDTTDDLQQAGTGAQVPARQEVAHYQSSPGFP